MAIWARFQDRPNIGVETLVCLAHLFDVSLGRPGLARHPLCRFRHAGHEVELAASGGRIIDDNVAVDSPPLCAGGPDVPAVKQGGRKYGAVSNTSLVNGYVRADDNFPYDRMNTVGADDRVCVLARAIGE